MARVLIVDDNPELREMLSDLLRQHDIEVLTAGTLNDAEVLLKGKIGLIVLDYFIAGFSGGKFFDRLKSDPATRDIPVLVCSGSADVQTLDDLVNRGAAGYLRKPFKTDAFVAKVKSLIP